MSGVDYFPSIISSWRSKRFSTVVFRFFVIWFFELLELVLKTLRHVGKVVTCPGNHIYMSLRMLWQVASRKFSFAVADMCFLWKSEGKWIQNSRQLWMVLFSLHGGGRYSSLKYLEITTSLVENEMSLIVFENSEFWVWNVILARWSFIQVLWIIGKFIFCGYFLKLH